MINFSPIIWERQSCPSKDEYRGNIKVPINGSLPSVPSRVRENLRVKSKPNRVVLSECPSIICQLKDQGDGKWRAFYLMWVEERKEWIGNLWCDWVESPPISDDSCSEAFNLETPDSFFEGILGTPLNWGPAPKQGSRKQSLIVNQR